MSKLYVDPATFRPSITTMGDLARDLNKLTENVNSIRGNLRYKIAGKEKIEAQLQEVAEQISKEGKSVKSLQSGLDQILSKYQSIENKNVGQLIADVISTFSGLTGANGVHSGEDLLKTPSDEMERFISDFEKEHPDQAKIFNKLLADGRNNQITSDDVRRIKYLTYNAEEPYRTIYLNSLSKFNIGNADLNGGAFYRPWLHTLNYSYPDDFNDDPRGAYTTFFHECGHAIDDLSDKSKWLGSDTESFKVQSDAMGREVTLREAIEYDVYYNTRNAHSVTSIANQIKSEGKAGSNGNIDNVISAFQSGNKSKLNKYDLILYNAVKNQHEKTIGSNATYEAVTDVYGGMSHNELSGYGYFHDTDYWDDKSNAGCELWAEYFSYNMAGNTESLENLIEYFPEASKVLAEYANVLGK